MTTKNKKTSRLTEALLETAKDMNNVGILGEAAYEKITIRHLEMTGAAERDSSQKHPLV